MTEKRVIQLAKLKLGVLIAAGLCFAACKHSEKTSKDSHKESISLGGSWVGSMHSLRGSVQNLLPYTYDTKAFENPENKAFIKKEVQNMLNESERMNHEPGLISRDPTVNFVSVSFKEDMGRIKQALDEGKDKFARYQLMRITSYCVDCHTRSHQGREFNFLNISSFPPGISPENKIEILIGSRNYDKAYDESLRSIKKSLASDEVERLALLGLQVAVQYQGNIKNSQNLIQAIAENKNTTYYLKMKNRAWKKSIDSWGSQAKNQNPLQLARTLISKKDKTEIDAMLALHSLLPFLTQDLKSQELGEAMLLAGRAYELLDVSSGSYLSESYYESCILRVPHSEWAQACYKHLDEVVTVGYSGSSGTHIPADIAVKLDKLKSIAH